MITKQYFGTMEDGRDVYSYTMKNAAGMIVRISELGAAIMEIRVPDKFGRFSDVVLGFDSIRDYVLSPGYLGAVVGRIGNRICKGIFRLEDQKFSLPPISLV